MNIGGISIFFFFHSEKINQRRKLKKRKNWDMAIEIGMKKINKRKEINRRTLSMPFPFKYIFLL
jgi:hypothetical protein